MGKVTDSLLSGTRGRTGRIVVSNIQGNEISRARPRRGNRTLTPKQQLITQRFNFAVQFIQGYKNLAKSFYGKRNGLKSAYNMAMSNLLKAISLDTVNLTFQLQHQAVQFTRGNRPEPQPTTFDSTNPNTIEINWLNNATEQAHETDILCVMIAEVINGQELTTVIQTNATRSSETATVQLLPKYQGEDVHLWISFINTTENEASNSTYLGQLTIA